MNRSEPLPATGDVAGIVVDLVICGVGSTTFHVTLTPGGEGALYDPESRGDADPITFEHALGPQVSTILDSCTTTATHRDRGRLSTLDGLSRRGRA